MDGFHGDQKMHLPAAVRELVLERVIDDLLVAGHPLVQQVKTKKGK